MNEASVRKEHWVIWYVAKRWYEIQREGQKEQREQRKLTITLLDKTLFMLNEEFKAKFGKPLLDLEFIMYFYGPYALKLEDILNECSAIGLIEYKVILKVPKVTEGLDSDYRLAVIEHQLSEIDAPRKYIRKIIEPKADSLEMPDDLKKLLNDVRCNVEELLRILNYCIGIVADIVIQKKKERELEEYIVKKYNLVEKEIGDYV